MRERFDAVVGSGLGGLTAGALSAHAGRRVLVLEHNHSFGGAATADHRGRMTVTASMRSPPHNTDDPDAMWWLTFVANQGSFLDAGGCFIRGRPWSLSEQLVARIRAGGGATRPRATVTETVSMGTTGSAVSATGPRTAAT